MDKYEKITFKENAVQILKEIEKEQPSLKYVYAKIGNMLGVFEARIKDK